MKICEKCGAHNSDDRKFCVDCFESLGEQLSEAENEEVLESIQNTIERIENKNDPLYVDLFDKIVGFASIAGIVALIGLVIAGIFTSTDSKYLLLGILLFSLSALEAFLPAISWNIEKFRLSIYYSNTDDVSPGMFYKFGRKMGIILTTAIGTVILIFGILNFINGLNSKPVLDLIDTIANYKPVSMSNNTNDYILACPEEWEEIISSGEKSVTALIDELKNAETTGIRELLMMQAVNEITGYNLPYGSASEFVSEYSVFTSLQKNY